MNQAAFLAARDHFEAGRFEQALAITQRELRKGKPDPGLDYLHAGVLSRLHRFDQALFFAQRAAAGFPTNPGAHSLVGEILFGAGKFPEAAVALEKSLALAPSRPVAAMRALIAQTDRDFTKAAFWYRAADAAEPAHTEARGNLALVLLESLQSAEARALVDDGLAAHPDNRGLLACAAAISNYLPDVDRAAQAAIHARYGASVMAEAGTHARPVRAGLGAEPARPLRIAYASPDFREHSCSRFIESLLAHHDRSRFHVVCYFDWRYPDATTARLRSRLTPTDLWRDVIDLDDRRFAEQVRKDQIDVLVDLAGLTNGNRLVAMAHRPAPVQLTYLGYPNTTGVPALDARLVDDTTDPAGAEAFATEPLARIPGCFLCYQPPPDMPAPAREPGGPIRFASFNILSKVNEQVVRAWASVLRGAPGSQLTLKSRSLSDKVVRERLAAMFGAEGISAERLDLLGYTASTREHLELYRRVDIALDTFPYNGTTTTCEALFMGVPVVTFAGSTHAGRVGASLLRAAGLQELVATDEEDYVRRAVVLAGDAPRLGSLRAGLRDRLLSSGLCDAPGFARRFEETVLGIWRGVRAG
jgi:Flp pilus assembly protein TadD